MKVKTTIYKFNPVVYPRNLYIAIGFDKDRFLELFEMNEVDEKFMESLSGDIIGFGVKVVEKDSRETGVLFIFRNRKFGVETIAHEAVHGADFIFEEIGAYAQDFSEKNEPFAYLTGWVANCINLAKLNKHDR